MVMAATTDEVNRRGGHPHVQEGERRDKTAAAAAAAAAAPATHYSVRNTAKPRDRHGRGWSSSPSNPSAAAAAALMHEGTTSLGLIARRGRPSMATSSSLPSSSSSSKRAPEPVSSLAGVGDRHARRHGGGDSMPIAGGALDQHRGSPAETRQRQHHVAATRRREARADDRGRSSGDRVGSQPGICLINSPPPLRSSASVASGRASSVPDAGRRPRLAGRYGEVEGPNAGDYDSGEMRSSLPRRSQNGGDGVNGSRQHATERWAGRQSSSSAMQRTGQNRRRRDTTQTTSQRRRDDDEEEGAARRYQNNADNGFAATIADDGRRSRPSTGVAPDQQLRDHRQNDIRRSGSRERQRKDRRRTPAVTRGGIELAATFTPASLDTDEDHPRRAQGDEKAEIHTAADVAAAAEAAVTAFVANQAPAVAALPSHASRHPQQPEQQRQHGSRRRRRQHQLERESPLSSLSWTTEVRGMPRPGRCSRSGRGEDPDRGGLPAAAAAASAAASGGGSGGSGVASCRPCISSSGSTSPSDSAEPWQLQRGAAKLGVSGGGSSSIPRPPAAELSADVSPEYGSRGRSPQSNSSEYLSGSAARGGRVDDPSTGRASRFRSGPQIKVAAAASVFSRSGYSSHSRLGYTHSSSSDASSTPRAGSSIPRRSARQTVLASSNSSSTGSPLSDRMSLTPCVQPRSTYISGGGSGGGGGGEIAHPTARNQHESLASAHSETAATPPELTVGDRPVTQGNPTSIGGPRIPVRSISYGEVFGRVSPCDPQLQQHQRRASPLQNTGGEEDRGGQRQGYGRRQQEVLRASYCSSPPSSSLTLPPPSPSSLTPLSTPGGGGGGGGGGGSDN
ncbi:unnamed protein product [Ectocarpus fasciculatus]